MTKRKYKSTEVYIEYSNVVLPEFDSKGKPDLLGWDDAVQANQPDRDSIATFYSPEYEKVCMPAILEHSKSVDLCEVYEADDAEIVVEHKYAEEEKESIPFFWEEIVDVGNGFSPQDHGWDENATDKDDNEYLWNEDEFLQQIPKYKDFVKSCQHYLGRELEWCLAPDGTSQADAVDCSIKELTKMMQLAVQIYGNKSWGADIYD